MSIPPPQITRAELPLLSALSKQHTRVVKIIPDRDSANFHTADRRNQEFLLLSAIHASECVWESPFAGDEPNADIAGFSGQPLPPPAEHNERQVASDFLDSIYKSANSNLSLAKPFKLYKPPSSAP